MGGIENARSEWYDGYRRFVATVDGKPLSAERLHAELEAVTAELRKRIGNVFTLQELAEVYTDSERWAREVVQESGPGNAWAATLSVVCDAAFHLFSRGAMDYAP